MILCLDLPLLLLIHVASLNVFARKTNVQLGLQIVPVNDPNCVGGPVAGLTNTSVLVQYRLLGGGNTEWSDLADISLDETFERTLMVEDVEHPMQFRLLQLEHGGGECNCWDILRFELTETRDNGQMNFDFSQTDAFNQYLCHRSGPGVIPGSRICGGDRGGNARGIVTKVFDVYNNGGSIIINDECPDNPGRGLMSLLNSIRVDDSTCTNPRM